MEDDKKRRSFNRALVIGGDGFLGRHIAEKLLEKGYQVNIFDIRETFENKQIRFFCGDLCEKKHLLPAMRDVDVVFHCASPSPLSNNHALFLKVNFHGTKNVISACKEAEIKKLVLTSSASVIYQAKDIVDGREDIQYPEVPIDYYTETKILQEKVVLEANSPDLHTVAIRPHGIFGPRDAHCIPGMANAAKAGKLKFIIGDGKNIVDFTYVDNVVHGHILAAEHLGPGAAICGKAYHITNDDPLPFWDFTTRIVTGLGYPAPTIKLPYWLIYFISLILHYIVLLLQPIKEIRPTFTPFTVAIAGTHHYYNCERAKRDMGYKPVVPLDEGIQLAIKHFEHLRNPKSR